VTLSTLLLLWRNHHYLPTILVGTKMDLRDDNETVKSKNSDKRPAFVSYGEGLAMAAMTS
jgi:hypothetical protein